MKGIFSLQHDTVQIEEFSYPLDEFLLDEPDFKAPKNGELTYHRGQGATLIIEGTHSEADKDYPSEDMELYIGRKPIYRSAYKARRSTITKPSSQSSTQTNKAQVTQIQKPENKERADGNH